MKRPNQLTRIFDNKINVNKVEQSARITFGQYEISSLNSSRPIKLNSKVAEKQKLSKSNSKITEMDRKVFTIWARHGRLWKQYRRETKARRGMLVEQRKTLSKPGTLRRRYDPHSQRTIIAPSRPNKHSREQISELDAELQQGANRQGAATSQSQLK